jgi:hypothetical protein
MKNECANAFLNFGKYREVIWNPKLGSSIGINIWSPLPSVQRQTFIQES